MELAQNATEGLHKIESGSYDLVLLDLMMPDRSGMEVLQEVRERDAETPIFMITAYGSVEVAVKALKIGANDYFSKPWDNEKLLIEIERMIARTRLESENTHLKRALKQRYSFPNIIGKSERMLRMLDLVTQVAPSRATILITGETGTGKELIAKAIHANSPRADQMFVAVNSGSVPPRPAGIHAVRSRQGRLHERRHVAQGLFRSSPTRAPSSSTRSAPSVPRRSRNCCASFRNGNSCRWDRPKRSRVDVRILAATNADLKKMVDEGKFREDLYYRLNVINIALPPLRDRKEDIPLLVEHFFTKYCRENEKFLDSEQKSTLRFEPDAMQLLMDYNWPGNVRELENAVERAVVLASETVVPASVLPDAILQAGGVAHSPR